MTLDKKKVILYFAIIAMMIGMSLWTILFFYFYKEDVVVDVMDGVIFQNVSVNKQLGRTIEYNEVHGNLKYYIEYPMIGKDIIDEEIKSIVKNIINNNDKKYLTDKDTVSDYYFLEYRIYIGVDKLMTIVFNETLVSSNLKLRENNNYSYVFDLKNEKLLSLQDLFNEDYTKVLSKYVGSELSRGYYFLISNDNLIINDKYNIPLEEIKDNLKIDVSDKNNYSNKFVEYKYSNVNKEMQAKSDLSLFSDDRLDSEIVANIKKNTKVSVYQNSENGFSKLLYDGKVVYVETKNLKEIKKPVTTTVSKVKMYAKKDLVIRSSNSNDSEEVGILKEGDSIIKTGTKGDWYIVEYESKVAYIKKSDLSTTRIKNWKVIEGVAPQGAIDPSKPMVVLTFDDGPNMSSTIRILNTLEKYNVGATFFDLGSAMLKYPEVVKREARIGEVATHTYSHYNLNTLSEDKLKREWELSKEAFVKVLGYEPTMVRAPYGNSNKLVKSVIDKPFIYWTIDTLDWKYRDVNYIMNEVDRHTSLDGKILLLHSIHSTTADAVEVLVPYLLSEGYQLVTVSQLAEYRGVTMQDGTVYYSFYK